MYGTNTRSYSPLVQDLTHDQVMGFYARRLRVSKPFYFYDILRRGVALHAPFAQPPITQKEVDHNYARSCYYRGLPRGAGPPLVHDLTQNQVLGFYASRLRGLVVGRNILY